MNLEELLKAEMVRGDLQQITDLHRYCMMCSQCLPILTKEKRLEYYNNMLLYIEKLKIFTTRISLHDSDDAREFVSDLHNAAKMYFTMLGLPEQASINESYDHMTERVKEMIKQEEAEGA